MGLLQFDHLRCTPSVRRNAATVFPVRDYVDESSIAAVKLTEDVVHGSSLITASPNTMDLRQIVPADRHYVEGQFSAEYGHGRANPDLSAILSPVQGLQQVPPAILSGDEPGSSSPIAGVNSPVTDSHQACLASQLAPSTSLAVVHSQPKTLEVISESEQP